MARENYIFEQSKGNKLLELYQEILHKCEKTHWDSLIRTKSGAKAPQPFMILILVILIILVLISTIILLLLIIIMIFLALFLRIIMVCIKDIAITSNMYIYTNIYIYALMTI